MRVLVTGAAGFIATNLIPRLLRRGEEYLGIGDRELLPLGKRQEVLQEIGADPRLQCDSVFDEADVEGSEAIQTPHAPKVGRRTEKVGESGCEARISPEELARPGTRRRHRIFLLRGRLVLAHATRDRNSDD